MKLYLLAVAAIAVAEVAAKPQYSGEQIDDGLTGVSTSSYDDYAAIQVRIDLDGLKGLLHNVN